GNIFSYPWDQKQLESQNAELQLGTLDLLTESPTQFFTDGSSLVEQVQWQSGASDSQTSGTVNNITWGTSMSVSYKPPKVTGGAIGSLTLSYNGSDSISSL